MRSLIGLPQTTRSLREINLLPDALDGPLWSEPIDINGFKKKETCGIRFPSLKLIRSD